MDRAASLLLVDDFSAFFVADGSAIEGFLPDEFPLHIEVRGCPAGLVIDSRWFESWFMTHL